MKIRALTNFAGIDFSFVQGQIEEVEEKLGRELIRAGLAERVGEIETATLPKAENTAVKYPKHAGGGWYILSNGKRVKGKSQAIKAQEELEG